MAQITPDQLTKAQNGDERALAGIISRMMPQVRFGALSLPAEGMESQDFVQEGLIGLMHAIDTYSPDRGARFETYGAACIQNAQFAALRAARRKKHSPLNSSVPLSEEQTIPGPEELAIQQEQMELWQSRFRSQLSAREQQVLSLFLEGDSYQEIAESLGCSSKAVEGALSRARRKLRSFL